MSIVTKLKNDHDYYQNFRYTMPPGSCKGLKYPMVDIIKPDWKAPEHIHAFVTTRTGGFSEAPYNSLNLGEHVGDDLHNVKTNRELLRECLDLPKDPVWLNQVHGKKIVSADLNYECPPEADGSFAKLPNKICIVLTADCLPVLLTNKKGSMVAALHCGWKGLAANIISECLTLFARQQDEVMAWLGPAIGPKIYEVSQELRDTFVNINPSYETAFLDARPQHCLMNLYEIARQQLSAGGVKLITGGDFCTFEDSENFYSYRRDQGKTGRMATAIWMARQL